MKKFITFSILISTLMLYLQPANADELTATGIMQWVKDRNDGDNQTAAMEMILIDKGGNKRIRKINIFTQDEEKDTKRLMIFTYPKDLAGTVFLTYDYYKDDKDDDLWLYLPALKKTKQIASTNKSGSFMGSDLNYSDMTNINLGDYDFDFYKNKEMSVRDKKVWVIEAAPKSKDIIDKTGYRKSLFLIRQDIFFMVRAIRWEKNEDYVKYIDIDDLELIENVWVGKRIYVNRKKNNETVHETVLTLSDIKFDQSIDEKIFSPHMLDKGL